MKPWSARDPSIIESFSSKREDLRKWRGKSYMHREDVFFFSHTWNVSETSVHGLWPRFDLRHRSTFCVELYHQMDSTYTVWQFVQCDISFYIYHYSLQRDMKELYCSMSFVCLLIGLITCWRKNRPYSCFVCCNLCFVSVKEVEKLGELAAGVCRDGSQWDCFGR